MIVGYVISNLVRKMVIAKGCGQGPGNKITGLGYISTVFKKVVNLQMHDNFCLSLADMSLGAAPNRVLIEAGLLETLPLQPGDCAWVGKSSLYIKDIVIHFTPEKDADWKQVKPNRASVENINEVLTFGTGACKVFLGLKDGDAFEEQIAELTWALARGEQRGVSLIGLGPGFTPAGEDVLVGYCALGKRLGWLNPVWCHQLIETAFTESTCLSATALYFAVQGQVLSSLNEVLQSIDCMPQLTLVGQKLVQEVGSTSGSDMLLGVLAACHYSLMRTIDNRRG